MPRFNQYAPARRADGSIADSSIQNYVGTGAGKIPTSFFRGVILRVFPSDGEYPGVRCSVYVYSSKTTSCGPLDNVLLTYPYSSMQGGDIMLPRPTRMNVEDITTGVQNGNLQPASIDGDHVLIGFIDGDMTLPVIVGFIPHPSADKGKDPANTELGDRILPTETDGSPHFRKHRGAFEGIDSDGNYVANTTKAHKYKVGDVPAAKGGGYTNIGEEVSSTEVDTAGVATSGNYTVKLKQNAKLLIEFEGGANSIQLTDNDGVLDITTSSTVNINADSVDVGNAATEAALLGTTYRSQESALMTTIQTQLTALTAALVPLAASPATPVTNGALVGLLSGPVAAINTAISTFEGASSSYLSTKVDIG